MEEAVTDLCTPYQLRCLFVILISEGAPAKEIFDTFKDYLKQDYVVNHGMLEPEAMNAVLFDIEQKLEIIGKSPEFASSEIGRQRLMYNEAQCWKKFEESQAVFNEEQKDFFAKIHQMLNGVGGEPLFLEGPAGTFNVDFTFRLKLQFCRTWEDLFAQRRC